MQKIECTLEQADDLCTQVSAHNRNNILDQIKFEYHVHGGEVSLLSVGNMPQESYLHAIAALCRKGLNVVIHDNVRIQLATDINIMLGPFKYDDVCKKYNVRRLFDLKTSDLMHEYFTAKLGR